MLIFADHKIPEKAHERLQEYGEIIPFRTEGIAYEAVADHPDIFFCKIANQWVIAPNTPEIYIKKLDSHKIPYTVGELEVGKKYPETAKYNVVCSDNYLLHNFRYTDSIITNLADNLDLIHVNQGYTRCSLLALKEEHFITSDDGVGRVLSKYKFDVLNVDPEGIILPGKPHGFIGGTAGIHKDTIFFLGSLNYLKDGTKVRTLLESINYTIVELYDGPLFDGGSILFMGL